MVNEIYKEFLDLLNEYSDFEQKKIPLCAAETYVSDFIKKELSSIFEGKYCNGNLYYEKDDDFIGGQYIHRLYQLLLKQCQRLIDIKYVDARTLTGMNCLAIAIQSLFKKDDKILITDSKQGGHASLPYILDYIGVIYEPLPYNYRNYCLDYKKINNLLKTKRYEGIIICQSDLINEVELNKIDIDDEIIIYDATQTLGMILNKIHKLYLPADKQIVMIGGTHKTLPGPTCGIMFTNNTVLIDKLDKNINPNYLRNIQPNHIASLLLALIEQEKIGKKYQSKIIQNANTLGDILEKKYKFNVAKISKSKYTNTHQLFLLTDKETMENIFENGYKYGITLNKKVKPLFKGGYGIRIGVQEITRYGFNKKDLEEIGLILFLLKAKTLNKKDEQRLLSAISKINIKKIDKFAINDLIIK